MEIQESQGCHPQGDEVAFVHELYQGNEFCDMSGTPLAQQNAIMSRMPGMKFFRDMGVYREVFEERGKPRRQNNGPHGSTSAWRGQPNLQVNIGRQRVQDKGPTGFVRGHSSC